MSDRTVQSSAPSWMPAGSSLHSSESGADRQASGTLLVFPIYHPSPEVMSQRVEGQMVLLHLGTDLIYGLNSTAARLWELLAAGRTPSEICDQLASEYDLDLEQAAREVRQMLTTMADCKLVICDD